MTMTIGRRVSLGFAGAVLVTAVLGGYCYQQLSSIDHEVDLLANDSLPGLQSSGNMRIIAGDSLSHVLKHVIAETPEAMTAIEAEMADLAAEKKKTLDTYDATITLDEDRQMFDALAARREAFEAVVAEVLPLSRSMKTKESLELINRKLLPIFKEYAEATDDLVAWNQANGLRTSQTAQGTVGAAQNGILIGIAAAVLVGIGVAYPIVRSTNSVLSRMAGMLANGADQVAAASAQVSSASQSLAQGSSEQAAALEETSSSLEEMSSQTKKNAETAQQAAALADDAQQAAGRGNVSMTKMGQAINDIQASAQETAKIIKVIDEIAFQTNLLALNAAVEAARAGEAGKGFAVVAEEVRNLAMRSAEAAKNTSQLIEQSVGNSRNGVTIAQEVGKVLAEITQSSEKVNGLIAEIAAATREQSTGIEQVNQAVGQMDKVTQQNAANAEESAAASEELASQAAQLQQVVGDLSALVSGGGELSASGHDTAGPTGGFGRASYGGSAGHATPARTAARTTTHTPARQDFDEFSQAA
ncbi:MAG: methyl-accepting chemotaxis protein [Phycisphaerae bacterium]